MLPLALPSVVQEARDSRQRSQTLQSSIGMGRAIEGEKEEGQPCPHR